MKFKPHETLGRYGDRIGRWHRWFAWHPVHLEAVDGFVTCVWLEAVERKGEVRGAFGDVWVNWEYREIE